MALRAHGEDEEEARVRHTHPNPAAKPIVLAVASHRSPVTPPKANRM